MHESRRHGFRLTVQDGSLSSPIGPIQVEDIFREIKCEDDSDSYLTTTVVNCLPAGIQFSDKPLFMDFLVDDTYNDDISDVSNNDDTETANDDAETANDSISETSDSNISETFQVCNKVVVDVVDPLNIVLPSTF